MGNMIFSAALTVFLLAVNAPLRAETPTAYFMPIEFLVGHCWAGPFPDGKAIDTHCFEWMLVRNFIRDRHRVKGNAPDYLGETIYFRDSAANKIAFRYWNTDGGISDGTLNADAKNILLFEEVYRGQDGKELKFQTEMERMGETQYQVRTRSWDGKSWIDAWAVTFTRVNSDIPGAGSEK